MQQKELNKRFKETQIGRIADCSIDPITSLYTLSDAKTLFEQNPTYSSIPVETNSGYGIIYRNEILATGNSLFSDDKIRKHIKFDHLSFSAMENVFQIARVALKKGLDHKDNDIMIYFKKSYFGLVQFNDLLLYVNELKALDEKSAKNVQQFLLNKSMPEQLPFSVTPYNQMASSIGGDFYHIAPINQDISLVSIFDVSGKGVTGALSTITLSSFFALFSMEEAKNKPPQWIVENLNAYIYNQTPHGVFITAILMFVNLKSKKVEIYNLGHTQLLSFRNKNGQILMEETASLLPPLGIDDQLPGISESCLEMEISSDRKIVLYSDGLSEATNEDGVMFG
ncbi:MAG: SpoIIE family protein phosphatase, partial [Spirochaetaceae bacterium]|nr:SpoIIE family protein phosphatase [Spirochaetaceae bacterium]